MAHCPAGSISASFPKYEVIHCLVIVELGSAGLEGNCRSFILALFIPPGLGSKMPTNTE